MESEDQSRVIANGNLVIRYEKYEFRGGAPPFRGYHSSGYGELEVSEKSSWESLCLALKQKIDENDETNLTFCIYNAQIKDQVIFKEEGNDNDNVKKTFNFPDSTVYETFITQKMNLKVYIPFPRGAVDIGTFVPYLNNMNDNQISLKYKESFNSSELHELLLKLKPSYPSATSPTFQIIDCPPSLQDGGLEALQNFADSFFNKRKEAVGETADVLDLKIPLTREKLIEFIGTSTMKELDELFGQTCQDIVLRRCSVTNHCIDFHVDYSFKTMQIAVNNDEEYEGGKLVFVCENKLEIPSRRRGTITLHDNTIIHGVTALRRGVRYGLFVLDRPNFSI